MSEFDLSGRTLGKYRVQQEIGRGGAGVLLHPLFVTRGGNFAIYLLLVLLAVLSTRRHLPPQTRRVLAVANLALALCTISLTSYLFCTRNCESIYYGGIVIVLSILELAVLLGTGVLTWSLFGRGREGTARNLIVLGSVLVVLSYLSVWVDFRYRFPSGEPQILLNRGYEIVLSTGYPWLLASAALLLPAMSLLGGLLLRPTTAELGPARRKKRAQWSVILTGLALAGIIVVSLIPFILQEPRVKRSLLGMASSGLWQMLAGLTLIFVGTVVGSAPYLASGTTGRQ